MGDYIGIAATPTAVHPIWTDNRNACDTVDSTYGCVDQDAYTVTISITRPPPLNDVSAYGLTASRNFDYSGVSSNPILVNLTAVNMGTRKEYLMITAMADSTKIGVQNITLAAGTSMTVNF